MRRVLLAVVVLASCSAALAEPMQRRHGLTSDTGRRIDVNALEARRVSCEPASALRDLTSFFELATVKRAPKGCGGDARSMRTGYQAVPLVLGIGF